MRIGKSYKQHSIGGGFDAIVIGSGIGGLTTAAMLAKHAGERVLVLERHYTAGGFTHAFFRSGYEWDVGVHYIGEVAPGKPMRQFFDEVTGGRLEWADMGEVYDKIVVGGDTYEFVRGRERWRRLMLEYFPHAREAIDGYLERLDKVARAAPRFFAEKALPGPIDAVAGKLMRRSMLRHARHTVHDVLSELTSDERLRTVLAGQWGDYGLPPRQASFVIHAMVASHYLEGGYYPVGGASRIAQTIEPVIEEAGGMVITSAEVDRIVVEGNRAVGVRMADGQEFRAPKVISAAGAAVTVGRLLPVEIAARHGLPAKLEQIPPSVAHMSLYVGLRHTAEELGLPRHNIWVYPADDHDANLARFLADPENAPLPLVFISFPSAKDPDFQRRHPGRATLEVVSLAPYEWFSRWEQTSWKRRGPDYEALKQRLTGRLLSALYAQVPQVEGKIDHSELSTPLSTRQFTSHPRGEVYGLAHTPGRFEAQWLRPRTPVKGLYLTGADIATAGVGGAMMAGMITASAVSGRNLLTAISKSARSSGSS